MPAIDLQDNLLRRIPPVLRARDFRLYTKGGKRLLDLWQSGGAAALGHTPAGVLRELKNTAERGLFTAFPHPMENRFAKALSRLFPGALFRVYGDEASLRQALAAAGHTLDAGAAFPDPAAPRASPGGAESPTLWRPFLDDDEPPSPSKPEEAALLIPILPWALAPKVLVIPESFEPAHAYPPSDILSPVILAAGTRSIYNLLAAGPMRGKVQFPKIRQALAHSPWRRRGIYLHYSDPLDDESYAALFLRFLGEGFLLPPNRNLPLILPGIVSPGEEAKLARLIGS
ncbi:MAG: hypothetical protein LBD55_09915 [Treponema sp.]|jgi:hypothetical protein|nr:hypothetical protein [Treponema sp.]